MNSSVLRYGVPLVLLWSKFMFRFRQKQNAARNAEYTTSANFCEIFEHDMHPLYLLAFLLTANHASAEQCFVASLKEALNGNAVFKEWACSWSKWIVIKQAIEIVYPTAIPIAEKRDRWTDARTDSKASAVVDAVTQFLPLERFVFVMSVLEECSDRKCCVLLKCTLRNVIEARIEALRKLPTFLPEFMGASQQRPRPQASGRSLPKADFVNPQEVRNASLYFDVQRNCCQVEADGTRDDRRDVCPEV